MQCPPLIILDLLISSNIFQEVKVVIQGAIILASLVSLSRSCIYSLELLLGLSVSKWYSLL